MRRKNCPKVLSTQIERTRREVRVSLREPDGSWSLGAMVARNFVNMAARDARSGRCALAKDRLLIAQDWLKNTKMEKMV